MKNVLFLHAGAELYGADRILINLVSDLDKERFTPIVVLPTDGPLVNVLRQQHIETHVIEYPILRRKYFNVRGIFRYLREYRKSCKSIFSVFANKKIDVIHVNTLAVLEGIYLKKLFNARLVWHVHEIITHPKVAYAVTSFLVGKFATQIIAVSNQVKKHLVASKMVPESKVKVIYNGIDTEKFRPHQVSELLQQDFSLTSENLTVGMIGRLNSWKGQPTLLKAMIPILKENAKIKLIFVGGVFEGEEHFRAELKQLIAQSGCAEQIKLVDFRTDMPDVYQLFDVFCLPSTSPDPLPTVVLEAMASGKPVVGFKHGGVTEMVQDGVNGYLASVGDTHEFGMFIQKLLNDDELRESMGQASRKRAIEKFSPTQFIEQFELTYAK